MIFQRTTTADALCGHPGSHNPDVVARQVSDLL